MLKRWLPRLLVGMLGVIMMPAMADAPRFEIAPFGGYRVGGEFDVEDEQTLEKRSADLDEDVSWGVGLALYRDRNAYYELLFSRQNTQFDSSEPALQGVDIATEYYHFGGTLIFDYEPWLRPYFSLTLGLTRFDADGFGSEYEFSGSVGFGCRMPLSEHVAFLAGVRGYATFVNSDTEFFCVSDGGATCLVQASGEAILQGEATLGFAVSF